MSLLPRTRFWTLGALSMVLAPVVGACGSAPTQARFDQDANPDVFGTLVDDRGTFEFIRNPDTGNIQRVEADIGEASGQIIPPTDGQDFSISREDNSSLTLEPTGANDVLVVVRGDPVVDDISLQVSRESLEGLESVVRQNTGGGLDLCEANEMFLTGACRVALAADVDQVVDSVRSDLIMRDQTPPDAETLGAVLTRYLVLLTECCLAWEELEGSVCTP